MNYFGSTDLGKINGLSWYFLSLVDSTFPPTAGATLTIPQIDEFLGSLNSTEPIVVNTSSSFFMSTSSGSNANVLGASFRSTIGGNIVDVRNKDSIVQSNVTIAGILQVGSLSEFTSLTMFIIDDPTLFLNNDNASNRTLASSILFAKLRRDESQSVAIRIDLYFQVLPSLKPNADVDYACVFYETNSSQWNPSGCSVPYYNAQFDRYECHCNHLTSFALIWLPKSSQSGTNRAARVVLDASDKASIAFQTVSIVCFLAIIIHGIISRIHQPQHFTHPKYFFPLFACFITMILFVFYIAASMTVYSRFASLPDTAERRLDSAECLPNENNLMFTVYFFLILMFCIKTGIAYLDYEHFVRLFPPPSIRKILIMCSIAVSLALVLVSVAAGIHSRSAHTITALVAGKLCWFTIHVIHYFLTIPICLFLSINIIVIVLVSKRICRQQHMLESSQSSYILRKRSVILILLSCVTQGVGWLLGPMMTIVSPSVGDVLAWLFIVFNGLEGLWIILLYIVVRKEGLDRNRRSQSQIPATVANSNRYRKRIDELNEERPNDKSLRDIADRRSTASFRDLYELNEIHGRVDDINHPSL